jgi:hypothetical protein
MPVHLNKLKGKGSVNQIPLLAKSSTKKGNVSTSQLKVKSKCPMAIQDREFALLDTQGSKNAQQQPP